ncbi:MAG: hypothetical protein COV66_03795 [Nitrospinae bacterium CG11_big_fil_rev_8_21_14_0_20_45_15]|nr:MAG: hypothetical protein COV66_03795 [Nitrospinae bacterium CG11_big_fil_rev_8_21_14_0_20_45_15]
MKKLIVLISTNPTITGPASEHLHSYKLSAVTPEEACNFVKGCSPSAIIWDRDTENNEAIESFRSTLGSYTPIILLTEDGPCKMDFKTWAEDYIVVQKGNWRDLSLALKQMHPARG